MKTRIILAISLVATMPSCQKEISNDPVISERMKLLTEKEWVVLKAEEKNDVGVWEDVFPQFEPCIQDNRFKFNTNFTLDYKEGANPCVPNAPYQVIGTEPWRFGPGENTIITDDIPNNILQLDASKLIVTTSETAAGVTYERRTTYRH